jgi:hypothetical protein
MTYAQIPSAQVRRVLQSVTETKRPSTVVKAMVREIERLHEENAQLHAAVAMYRAAYERDGEAARMKFCLYTGRMHMKAAFASPRLMELALV